MKIERLLTLATEIFKTINSINSNFMKKKIALGTEIWNQLTSNIKSLTSNTKSKEYIRTWFGPSCKCNICRMI